MVSQQELNFYIYFWLREDAVPYYVGKGAGRRAVNAHRVPKPPTERILIKACFSEEEALELERFFIALYGRVVVGTGCLHNLTIGGQRGPSGLMISEETRKKKMGNKNALGHKPSLASRKLMGDAARNRSIESTNKIRLAKLGKKASEETRRKMSLAALGRKMPRTTRLKIAETLRGKKRCIHQEKLRSAR